MAIGTSNKVQETYRYQTEAGATKHSSPHAVKLDALSLPSKTNWRDVFEHSDSDRIFTGYGADISYQGTKVPSAIILI